MTSSESFATKDSTEYEQTEYYESPTPKKKSPKPRAKRAAKNTPIEVKIEDQNGENFGFDAPNLPELDEKTLEEIRRQVHPNKFPKKIWLLASNPRFTPIVWNSLGNGILVNERLLTPNVLASLFRSNKMASFLRQLHLYDFGKINRARSYSYLDENGEIARYQIDFVSEYTRDKDFCRSDISTCSDIYREYRPVKKTVKRGFLFPDDESEGMNNRKRI